MPESPAGAQTPENDPPPSAAHPLASADDYATLDSPGDGAPAPSPADAPAATAPSGSRFTVLRLHAKGGLGLVSVARDEKLNRPVALKEIRPEGRGHADLRQRFLAEAEITGQLEHPGVVPIYDLEQGGDGQVRYAMRFVQGRTLSEAIRDYHRGPTPLGFRELLQRFIAVCQTVAYAHSQGVIHRDLKPANVVLGDYGETLVVDWGLAKRLAAAVPAATPRAGPPAQDPVGPELTPTFPPAAAGAGPLTQAGHVLGTPAYMAPEQAAGDIDGTGTPADVYSLGAVLYQVLTGQPPYRGKDAEAVLAAVRQGHLARPRQVRRAVPRALEAVCLKALARAIPHRYATAADLARDVERWLADERVSAYREPWLARAGRFARTHRPLVAGAAALLLTAVVGLALGLAAVERERAQTATERDEKARALAAETRARAAEAQFRKLAMSALGNLTDNVVEQQLARRTTLTAEDRRFLRSIRRQYEEFAALPGEEVEQRAIRAAGHYRVGLLQFRLGELKEAEASYRQAVALSQRLATDFPNRPEFRRELAASHGNLGGVLRQLGRPKEAEAAFADARALWRRLADDFPTYPEFRQELALSLNHLGQLLRDQGRWKEAEAPYTEALELLKRLAWDPLESTCRHASLSIL